METVFFVSYLLNIYAFKSYYVVWKHRRRHASERKLSRFKSYYVVWKPNIALSLQLSVYGLNRTM